MNCNKLISHSFVITGGGGGGIFIKLSALTIQLVPSIQQVSWGYKNFVKIS